MGLGSGLTNILYPISTFPMNKLNICDYDWTYFIFTVSLFFMKFQRDMLYLTFSITSGLVHHLYCLNPTYYI
jgi:uncharacterized ion transporter superfamily protein YfcC